MEVANWDSKVQPGTSLYQTFASIQQGQGTVDQNEDGAPAISVGGVLSMGSSLQMFQLEESGLDKEMRWHQHESWDAQASVALHVVCGRKQQATDGSAHTASDSNWCPTENTGMEIDGKVPGQEQCMGNGGGGKKRDHEFRVPTCCCHGKAPNKLNCQAAICKHVNELMGRKCTNAPPEPASMEAILNYKSTLDEEDSPSMEHFQADFSEKSPGCSMWNHRLCDLFVADYVKKGLPFTTVMKLSIFFMTYLETLQTANRKMAATAEQEWAYKEASHRNRIAKWKKTWFNTQISALHYYKISRFIKPLREMSHAVLSDNKSDHEQGTHRGQSRYSIVNEAWRSKELVVWLRTIDLLACSEKWGGHNVARQEWLNSLKCYQRDKLDVQPPMDLAFSEEEKRLAAQFIPLAKGDVHPVNQDVVNISTLENWLLHGRLENC
ncbi:hypothetical protein EDB87DRAFT_1574673 [Lactarius vividus]|nr:hypothetical protein EDB87DRAFT_1574673 [Lactarius vividus]